MKPLFYIITNSHRPRNIITYTGLLVLSFNVALYYHLNKLYNLIKEKSIESSRAISGT